MMTILTWVMLVLGIAWRKDALMIMALLLACTNYLAIKIDRAAQRGREE